MKTKLLKRLKRAALQGGLLVSYQDMIKLFQSVETFANSVNFRGEYYSQWAYFADVDIFRVHAPTNSNGDTHRPFYTKKIYIPVSAEINKLI